MPWPVICETKLKRAFWTTPLKMSPVMNFVGGMYFSGASGKISRAIRACASSSRKPFRIVGSISKAWPRPICHGWRPAAKAKRSFRNWLARTVYAFSTASDVVR